MIFEKEYDQIELPFFIPVIHLVLDIVVLLAFVGRQPLFFI